MCNPDGPFSSWSGEVKRVCRVLNSDLLAAAATGHLFLLGRRLFGGRLLGGRLLGYFFGYLLGGRFLGCLFCYFLGHSCSSFKGLRRGRTCRLQNVEVVWRWPLENGWVRLFFRQTESFALRRQSSFLPGITRATNTFYTILPALQCLVDRLPEVFQESVSLGSPSLHHHRPPRESDCRAMKLS